MEVMWGRRTCELRDGRDELTVGGGDAADEDEATK